ncbi:glycosyltransferase family 4 protein [Frondihabitans australicus]|uniref:Glycosyltransferase involved in cell wall biosynthesis n=1 Tax=Frondihabitans australicus TaxID=386892 RepID=A0A495IIN7_9MICO|nr:glycosyltransferase family 4 protein [Frondihabitans australicus]RKR75649.1 glycosyltransferase involved in cell wall biosynthesis [Frondihabitans australicus]
MKIALFTPTHAQSAIGRVSALVRSALQVAGHDVAVVATELTPLDTWNRNPDLADSTHWTQAKAVRQIAVESDIVFHQVGDHYPFHAGNVHWLPLIGGCVALHDFFMGDMFLSWIADNGTEAAAVLDRWYGLDLGAFLSMASSGQFVERAWPAYPLTEWICQYADGVIAHSDFGLAAVQRSTPAPVIVVPLPYDLPDEADAPAPEAPLLDLIEDDEPEKPITVLTFGRINRNKLCDDVIAAISIHRSLRTRIAYRVVGSIEESERHRLRTFADDLGVDLTVTGEVSSAQLLTELQAADVIVCTRKPTLESASASAIEGMLSGTPLIVVDAGFYAGLPRDAVLHVEPREIQRGISRRLRDIAQGTVDLVAMGAAAKKFAHATFRADTYASELVSLGIEAARRKPLRELELAFPELASPGDTDGADFASAVYAADTLIFRP